MANIEIYATDELNELIDNILTNGAAYDHNDEEIDIEEIVSAKHFHDWDDIENHIEEATTWHYEWIAENAPTGSGREYDDIEELPVHPNSNVTIGTLIHLVETYKN